jgi:hypothetical protein
MMLSRGAHLVVLVALAPQVAPQACVTADTYLDGSEIGLPADCAGLLAAGYSCEDLACYAPALAQPAGGARCGVQGRHGMAGQCSLTCGQNTYDGVYGEGACDSLIAAGTTSCATDFGAYQAYPGSCDFSCGFCSIEPAPDPLPLPTGPAARGNAGTSPWQCNTRDYLDDTYSAGVCAAHLGIGDLSCNEHFGAGNTWVEHRACRGVLPYEGATNCFMAADDDNNYCPDSAPVDEDGYVWCDCMNAETGQVQLSATQDECYRGGLHAGQCAKTCELNIIEHPTAFMPVADVSEFARLVEIYWPAVGATTEEEFVTQMQPGLCQILIEDDLAQGYGDACSLQFNDLLPASFNGQGMCDFACNRCAAFGNVWSAAEYADCGSSITANAADVQMQDPTWCDTALRTGLSCYGDFAPGKAQQGFCDYTCFGAALVSLGSQVAAHLQYGIEDTCTAEGGVWVVHTPANAICKTAAGEPTGACCANPTAVDAPQCASWISAFGGADVACPNLFAPDRMRAGQCDIVCGYCSIECGAHGRVSGGSCICDSIAYTGDHCENFDSCYGVDCGAHGRCSGGRCICESSAYTGDHCQNFGASLAP